jgi:Cys-tRNA(Pro)/Cys-tRNA(Cys) deacylase
MARKSNKGGTPATTHLTRAGVPFNLHEVDFALQPGAIGIAAAEAMGVEPARVFKTLIIETDQKTHAMAMIRVDAELDLKAVAAALGAKKAGMAEIRDAERMTGYIKGGISPFGQKKRLAALIDEEAIEYGSIYVSGGQRGLEIEIAPADLCAVIDAKPARIARS